MNTQDVLIDALSRSRAVGHEVVEGVETADLNRRIEGTGNSISWLVWHLAREQDAQIANLADTEQVWLAAGWVDRFGLDLPRESMGYGHTPAQAARVVVDDPSLLTGYLDAAADATVEYLRGLDAAALDTIIDREWDPPVTLAVRLVSIIDDAAQHAGQAAYVHGLVTSPAS